jgi:glycerol kinase
MVEATGLGAAFLAGLGRGLFADLNEISRTWKKDRVFTPGRCQKDVSETLERWRAAVAKT